MSERIQRNAKGRLDAAKQRERNANERARVNANRGNQAMARLHQSSADRHGDAAADAETLLELDRQVEGDQLGDEPRRPAADPNS